MSAPQWISFAYPVSFKEKRCAHVRRGFAHDRLPVRIENVDAANAPVAFEVDRGDHTIAWRVIDGILMRDVIGLRGAPGGIEALDGTSTHVFGFMHSDHRQICEMFANYSQVERFERDVSERANMAPGWITPTGRHFNGFIEDGRDTGIASASAFAAKLRMVEGRLMVPAPEPMWAVNLRIMPPPSIELSPVIPFFNYGGMQAAFRIDNYAAALNFAENVGEQVRGWAQAYSNRDPGDIETKLALPSACRDFGVWQPQDDPRFLPMRAMAGRLETLVGAAPANALPLPWVAAYGVLLDSIGLDAPDADRAIEAWRRLDEGTAQPLNVPREPSQPWRACVDATVAAALPQPDIDEAFDHFQGCRL